MNDIRFNAACRIECTRGTTFTFRKYGRVGRNSVHDHVGALIMPDGPGLATYPVNSILVLPSWAR